MAVQDPDEAPAILRAGFAEARARGARLVVLHAWWLASGFDVVVVDGAMRAEWTARSRAEMQPVFAPLRQAFPDVEVTNSPCGTLRRSRPSSTPPRPLTCSSWDGGTTGCPSGSHLGPVVRAALDHGTCPVLVAPEFPAEASQSSTVESNELATTQAREPAHRSPVSEPVPGVRRARRPRRDELLVSRGPLACAADARQRSRPARDLGWGRRLPSASDR